MIARTLFDDGHEAFRETVRRFIAKEIEPHYSRWEKEGVVSREVWRAAGEAGLLCTWVPEKYGGAGADFLYGAVVVEEMGRSGYAGVAFHLHSDIVAPYVYHYGSEAQKQKWLPKLVTGEVVSAVAMSEPAAGSDLQGMTTRAQRDGDEYVINGQKTFISNGQLADLVVLACKTNPSERAKGISQILIESDASGFERGKNFEKVGYHAQDTSELFFADCRVPIENLLGEEGSGFVQMVQQLPQERLVIAIRSAAIINSAIEWTARYVNERKAFGKTLANFQNTRFKLAEMKTKSVVTQAFVDVCILQHLAGNLDAIDAAMAKLHSTETMGEVLDDCVQLHGGYGYMWEFPIARAWADNRMARIAGGSSEIMKEIIGRTMVDPK
ncbi:MAG TPA: acyl-CoA dehydrogenase [Gammaproteobacteria bacterium]|nr:acyl-CoA dehydrogenase [Gammaproteobacteria bacterium]|tara:strand:+ start:1225 stop:2373 length:1149 start_codon:yes stop_codon:yes gene_type:complete